MKCNFLFHFFDLLIIKYSYVVSQKAICKMHKSKRFCNTPLPHKGYLNSGFEQNLTKRPPNRLPISPHATGRGGGGAARGTELVWNSIFSIVSKQCICSRRGYGGPDDFHCLGTLPFLINSNIVIKESNHQTAPYLRFRSRRGRRRRRCSTSIRLIQLLESRAGPSSFVSFRSGCGNWVDGYLDDMTLI